MRRVGMGAEKPERKTEAEKKLEAKVKELKAENKQLKEELAKLQEAAPQNPQKGEEN